MEASFTPTSRGGAKLCYAGRVYRFQKNLAGGQMRWKCVNAEWNFKCGGYAVTDGKVPGSAIVRTGDHASHCEPSASKQDVAAIRHAVISTAGGSAGVTPVRAVAECIGGAGSSVLQALPTSASLKRSAQNAAFRARKKAQADGEAGFFANYNSLEELRIPPSIISRRDGDEFLLYDSGPGEGRILLLGTQDNVRALQSASVWGADGTFKVCPRLWAQLYTIHAVVDGYCLPCIYALLPGKSQGVYNTMWGRIRELVGEHADKERLVTMDFERASINAVEAAFPQVAVGGCFFHLGQAVYRRVQSLGLAEKYGSDDEFKLRVKKLSALAFLPLEYVVEGFELVEGEFLDEEQELVAYFEATYVGRRGPNGRRRPLFDTEWWNVDSRMHTGALRTNNAIEAFHNAFACSAVQADHPHICRFLEAIHLQQNMKCGATEVATQHPITDREMAELEAGRTKCVEKRQEDRNARLATLVVRFLEDTDVAKLVRGIAWNYMT